MLILHLNVPDESRLQHTVIARYNSASPSVPYAGIRKTGSAQFDDFNEGNDPYGEHDFGSFELCGRKFFWKIELYEEPGVKDKNGEPVVTRVLTIMLASEH